MAQPQPSPPSVSPPAPPAARQFEIDRRPIAIVLLSRLKRQLWLAFVVTCFALLLRVPPPDGLAQAGWNTLCIFALCGTLWVTSLLPLAITSLVAIASLPLFGVMRAEEAYQFFGSKVVFFVLGAFMLSAALIGSGLSKRLATLTVRAFGGTPRRLVLAVFGLCAVASTVMSGHAVAAMVFPIVLDIARAMKLKALRSRMGAALFFALAWGCIIGSSLTVLGGGRGPLAIGLLEEATGHAWTITFMEFIAFGAPLVVLMLAVGAVMLAWRFPPEVASTADAIAVLEGRLRDMGKMSGRERAVALVLVVTIAAWAALGDTLGIANIAILAMAALFALGAVTWPEVEENVNWGVIVMYGGAIALGSAMDRSGAALWLTEAVLGGRELSPLVLMMVIALLSGTLTELMSNSAVVAMLMPPALTLAEHYGLDPRAMTMCIVLPSGFAFMFPISTPVTAIAWSAGYYTPRQVAQSGLWLNLIGFGCVFLLMKFWWPLLGVLWAP